MVAICVLITSAKYEKEITQTPKSKAMTKYVIIQDRHCAAPSVTIYTSIKDVAEQADVSTKIVRRFLDERGVFFFGIVGEHCVVMAEHVRPKRRVGHK